MKKHANTVRLRGNTNAQHGESPSNRVIRARVSEEQHKTFIELAKAKGLTLTALIISLLEAEAAKKEVQQ